MAISIAQILKLLIIVAIIIAGIAVIAMRR